MVVEPQVSEALNTAIEASKSIVPTCLPQVLPEDSCKDIENSLKDEALIAKSVLKTIPFIEQAKSGNLQLLKADVDELLRLDISNLPVNFRTPLQNLKQHVSNAAVGFMKTSVASLAQFVVDLGRDGDDGTAIVSE